MGASYFFLQRNAYASAVLRIKILSICPSVHHTSALWQKEKNRLPIFQHLVKSNLSSFVKLTMVDVECLVSLKILAQSDLLHNASASKRNVIITNRKSTTGFQDGAVSYS